MMVLRTIGLPVLASFLVIVSLVLAGFGKSHPADDRFGPGQQLVVASWGGAYQDAQRRAFFEPFTRETGIEIVEARTPGLEEFLNWEEAGRSDVDVVDVETYVALQAADRGLLQPIDFEIVDTTGLIPSAVDEFSVATVAYAVVIAWNRELHPHWNSLSWTDFWNVGDYPGPRGLHDQPASTLEAGRLATGTPVHDLYPLDVDRAFDALERLRDTTPVLLWDAGDEPIGWLLGGDVSLTTAWNGRVHDARLEGNPIEMTFDGGMIDWLWWVVPKGAPSPDLAQRFIAFTMRADRQAELARLIPYGPTNQQALDLLGDSTLAELPTSPENLSRLIVRDNQWWRENDELVQRFWREWRVKP